MRKFSTTMLILFVVMVLGTVYTMTTAQFYETRYVGHLVQNGKTIPGSEFRVSLNEGRNRFTVEVEMFYDEEPSAQVKRLLGDRTQFTCTYNVPEPMKLSNHRIGYEVFEEANTATCGRTRIVFNDIDNGKIQLKAGAIMDIKRMDPRDPLLNARQHMLFDTLAGL